MQTHTLLKLKNARRVVSLLGGVQPGMNVLILCDLYTTNNVEPLMIAAHEAGACTTMMQMTQAGNHGGQLPGMVASAMAAADLVIGATRYNITHTSARIDAQKKGVKVIALPESDGDAFFLARGWDVDFAAVRPQIEALANALTEAESACVRSSLGTNLTCSIAGRKGRALTGFANTKDVSAGYCLEASLAPVEGTANGTIVVNASIPGVSLIETQPVIITIEEGMATSIEGGREADAFRSLLASFNDPLVYNLGELGVGMNPSCQLDGTMLSDESVFGAIQLALGTSLYIGGTVKAAAHYDTIVTDAVLELDGRTVLKGTELLLPY
jgi:leucyl aminopeptidase (aminopeptidase T)